MPLNTIDEIIDDIRHGKPVILMDDEDRENEGDLIIAAEKVSPEWINFMAKEARGLLCLTLTGERCDFLNLPSMVGENNAAYSTPFTVSIEAATGVTTGISAADRARTIQVAVSADSQPSDIVQPGHVFPLRAQPGGVLSRAGHTEAGCDLARLAGLTPAAAIIEIMNDDGTMARRPDLEIFAEKHNLKIGTIADLIHYRLMHERSIQRKSQAMVQTQHGEFIMTRYADVHGASHVSFHLGELSADQPVPVRVHVTDPLRDVVGVQYGGAKWTVAAALEQVQKEGVGVVVLIGADSASTLGGSLDRFEQGDHGLVVDKNGSYVTIGIGSQILKDLGVGQMTLMSSPVRFGGISGFGLHVVEYLQLDGSRITLE